MSGIDGRRPCNRDRFKIDKHCKTEINYFSRGRNDIVKTTVADKRSSLKTFMSLCEQFVN